LLHASPHVKLGLTNQAAAGPGQHFFVLGELRMVRRRIHGSNIVGCALLWMALPTAGCSKAPTGLEIGKVAPEIEGEDIDGQRFKLSDYRGKVVVLDFWGNW
jgi:hypothetical protein